MSEAIRYLVEQRGVDEKIAAFAEWDDETDHYSQPGEFRIPYFDALGRVRDYRYHHPQGKLLGVPKYRSRPGARQHLYCVENCIYSRVIICEGEIDTLSCLSVGLKAVGLQGASSFHKAWVHLFNEIDDLIIALDNDLPGQTQANRLNSLLPDARIVRPPEGKDLNDVLREQGADALANMMEKK